LSIDCKALVPDIDGETHEYIDASAGCWAIYNEVLASNYANPLSFSLTRLIGDTYAVQHPGKPARKSAQSVNMHLMSLYAILEKGYSPEKSKEIMRQALEKISVFV
jgi:hypothetical protein